MPGGATRQVGGGATGTGLTNRGSGVKQEVGTVGSGTTSPVGAQKGLTRPPACGTVGDIGAQTMDDREVSQMTNPYYNPEDLELEMLEFDEPDLSYEYNTLCFWATVGGQVYSASDSGCSCPTPFEDYEGGAQADVLPKLERVGSVEQGLAILDSWNKGYDGRPHLDHSHRDELADWLKEKVGR